jgi:hypothetical protein
MRELSSGFMHALKSGFLSGITYAVVADRDLDLYIRDNYVNVYYKGCSLLKLTEASSERYKVYIDPKFLEEIAIPDLVDEETVGEFVAGIPTLKENIIRHGKTSQEIEYEQLIIRANNDEARNNSEYFVVDRQYAIKGMRLDLLGFFWEGKQRRKRQTVAPCVMEVKFALNPDIGQVHEQLASYYEAVKADAAGVAQDAESSFRQRLELGLYCQSPARLKAMKTLVFARDIEQFQFILVLVDYNPYSSQFDPTKLKDLSFAAQVKVFLSGFAMWGQRLQSVDELLD